MPWPGREALRGWIYCRFKLFYGIFGIYEKYTVSSVFSSKACFLRKCSCRAKKEKA